MYNISDFRYFFLFQLPYFPEVVFRMGDMKSLESIGKGTAKPGCYTEDDLEACKYSMRYFGKMVIQDFLALAKTKLIRLGVNPTI